MKPSILFLLLAFALASCSRHQTAADQVIIGKIWTGDPAQLWVEAMAIKGDSIIATGSASDIRKLAGDSTITTVLRDGEIVLPGFIDTHTHFVKGGLALSSVQLR
jgi:predicted amidohydrolase YtcJ